MENISHMKNISPKLKIDSSVYLILLLAMLSGFFKPILLSFIIVLFHELGHIISFIIFKIPLEKVVIYPFGGMCYVNKKIHERIYKDIICSIAGIVFQLLLLIIFTILNTRGIILNSTYNTFTEINKSILLFNLLPLIPLDGSKLLLSILTKFLSFKKSYTLTIIFGIIGFISFVIHNLIFRLNDIFIYTFLLFKLIEVIKNYKYILNKFYLERVLYDHYYDGIINDSSNPSDMKINKYCFFKKEKRYINEKDYLKKNYFPNNS